MDDVKDRKVSRHGIGGNNPPNPIEQIVYTIDEAAKTARLSRAFLYQAIKANDLKSLRIGARRLIMRDDLLAWLNSKRQAA